MSTKEEEHTLEKVLLSDGMMIKDDSVKKEEKDTNSDIPVLLNKFQESPPLSRNMINFLLYVFSVLAHFIVLVVVVTNPIFEELNSLAPLHRQIIKVEAAFGVFFLSMIWPVLDVIVIVVFCTGFHCK